jgi:ABC-type uncharacterized transport system ATPase subunit
VSAIPTPARTIVVEHLEKTFRVAQHRRGALGAIRNLFSGEYREVRAVDDISFRIGAGEMAGFIGPNGAGKRQLSVGQRMRGDLAAALLHDPDVVYLDEPAIGLDVVAKHRMRGFLRRINRGRGVTILLTTHDVADLEQLCERLLIIDHGRLLYDHGLSEIRDRYGASVPWSSIESIICQIYEQGMT